MCARPDRGQKRHAAPVLHLVRALTACATLSCGDDPAALDGSSADASNADAAAAPPDAGSPGPSGPQPLVDHGSWQRFDAALDPLASHQPAHIECGIAGWFLERGLLEVDTGRCNYLLVEHPSLHDVPEGASVTLELFHYDLTAPEPSEAHLAVLFGDALQWETTLSIPGMANVITARFETTRALAKGDPVRLHLHNHGQNTWTLVSIVAGAP